MTLGDGCFEGCANLVTIEDLPATVRHIGKDCFKNCEAMTSLNGVPPTVLTVGEAAFDNCSHLSLRPSFPGFSPGCTVHRLAFRKCDKVRRAVAGRGFRSMEVYGRYVWAVAARRVAVLLAVGREREKADGGGGGGGGGGEGEELLERLARSPDDIVREILEFAGRGGAG